MNNETEKLIKIARDWYRQDMKAIKQSFQSVDGNISISNIIKGIYDLQERREQDFKIMLGE